MNDSRFPGLHKLALAERVDALLHAGVLDRASADCLKSGRPLLPASVADKMIENVIGTFALPFAVAPNFLVNGVDRLVPMVVEEPSIVAGLSGAAKLVRAAGGFQVTATEALLAGQVQLVDIDDPDVAIRKLRDESTELLASVNGMLPKLVERGGGCRDLEFYKFRLLDKRWTVIVHVLVDTCDAMGANAVNGVCERLAPSIAKVAGGRVVLRILSNLADRAVVNARMTLPTASLATGTQSGEAVRDAIVLAGQTANVSVHRAATHNKGIMNGIDAVAVATGNDWRAIEAGAHAYAVRGGAYRALTDWHVASDGQLVGELLMPLKVGTVGGSLSANPGATMALKIAGVASAGELAELMAAVGLAQNFAALRALVTHGIQHGHMRLHARSVAATAGVPEPDFDAVVDALIASGDIKVWKAKELHAALKAKARAAGGPSGSDEASGRGGAAGKTILLGEHAVVYGREALALPLPRAVACTVHRTNAAAQLELVERGAEHLLDPAAQHGVALTLRLILRKLKVGEQRFRVRVESRIPFSMGLGASAAFAVAIIRAFDQLLRLGMTDREVDQLAFECEKLAHGTPSGIDNNLATFAEPVLFSRGTAIRTKPIRLKDTPPVVVAASGIRGATQTQVSGVRDRHARHERLYDSIFDEMGELSVAGAAALRDGDFATLGALMNVCHGLLNAIEVSHPVLEDMIQVARDAGAVGAKLTGAGGGGSIVTLCPGREDAVARALQDAGHVVIRLRH